MIAQRTMIKVFPRIRGTATSLLLVTVGSVSAQLTVTSQSDLDALVNSLQGQGIRIENPTIDCHSAGYGTFNYNGTALEVTDGVLLTTGSITNAIGPNTTQNSSFEQNTTGDPLLNATTGRSTLDACRFEFDLIASGDSIAFDYVFASEEYHEWVGSQFNDVFGIYISGPGITGDPSAGNEQNIALVPGTSTPVSINTVNSAVNIQHFQDNTGGQHIQYDAGTRRLTATSPVIPCQSYHIKVVIADASDRLFDSGIFLQKLNSNTVTMSAFTNIGIAELVEGCNSGHVRFSRAIASALPLTVEYYLQGTAINGTDYTAIGITDPAVPKQAIIPGGATYVDVPISPIADGSMEGTEHLRFILGNPVCPSIMADTLEIALTDELPGSVTPNAPVICNGGSVQFSATGGTSYSWTGAGLSSTTSASPIATPAGTSNYSVLISNGSCSRIIDRTITVVDVALSAVITRPLCNGQSNGAVNLTVSGGNGPYTYNWSGPGGFSSSTEDLVNIGAGTYTVMVTSASGCSKTQSFNVTMPAVLSATTNATVLTYGQNIACGGTNSGSITLSVTGGTAPYAYSWTGPDGFSSTAQNISNVVAGSYSVTVTDQNGCSVSADRTLTEPPALTASIGNVSHVLCHGNNTGSATVVISGGVPPYSISWNTSPVQTTATATGLPAGNRLVTVTDGYGCTTTSSVVITQPSAPLVANVTNITDLYQCQGQNNPHGSATAAVTGGTPPYSYSWNTIPAQYTQTVELGAGGTYTTTVTDANGCTSSASFSVSQPGNSSISISQQTNNVCNGGSTGSATITVSGSSNIQWAQWNTTPPQSGLTLTDVPAGTYQVIAQHSNGCQSVASVTITEPASISAPQMISSGDVLCFGDSTGSAEFQVSGGAAPYTYTLNGQPIGSSLINYPAGIYTIVTTDANGCTAQGEVTISGPAAPLSVSITAFTNELCFGGDQGTASAQASGGTPPYTYTWNTVPEQTGSNATDLAAGTYAVTVTDANGCTASTQVTISEPQFAIHGVIENFANETCYGANDGWATVTAWGGSNSFSITWNTVPPQYGPTATGLAPGMYMVEVVDNNGCDTPKYLPVVIDGAPSALTHTIDISNYNGSNISCNGGSDGWIDLTINGGAPPYYFSWSDEFGNVAGMEDPTGLEAGTYYLHINDSYGCVVGDTIVLDAPEPIVLEVQLSIVAGGWNVSCAGATDGSADLNISGGTPPYEVQWSSAQGFSSTSEDLQDIAAGVYDVTVTDANGCVTQTTISLISPPAIDIDATISVVNGGNVSCAGGTDGWIDLTVTGGSGNYIYQWNNDAFSEDLSSITAGTFSVVVTDDLGCTATSTHTLTAPDPIIIDLQVLAASGGFGTSCAGSTDGSINTTISGGMGGYTILWNGPAGYSSDQASLTGLTAGAYMITVTDVNGCASSSTATITDPSPLNIALNSTSYNGGYNISCNGMATGDAGISISGGIAPYTIQWNGPDGFSSISNALNGLVAGSYSVIVTDANGCTTNGSITLTQPDTLSVVASIGDAGDGYQVSCTGNDGSIDLSITGGTPEFSYSWNGPGGFGSVAEDISALAAGTYELVIMDANGCLHEQTFDLTAPAAITAHFTVTENICFGDDAGSIDATVAGGSGAYTYAWTGPDGPIGTQEDLTDLIGGTYQLEVSSDLGCSAAFTATIADPTPLQSGAYVSFYGQYNLQCVGDSSGVIDLSPFGGTAPYQIVINGPDGYFSNSNSNPGLFAGDYLISVTDANGCMADTSITLTEPIDMISAEFNVSLYPSGTNVSCFGASDGWIEATVTGGGGNYEIFWRGPDSLEYDMANIYDLPAGDYSYELVVIDANQCTFSTNITLTQPDSALLVNTNVSTYDQFSVTCHDSQDGWIDAEITGGSGGYTHSWTLPDGTQTFTLDLNGIGGGAYHLSVSDINGCTSEQWINVVAPEAVGVALSIANVSCSGGNDGGIQADLYGGTGTYVHSWNGPIAPGSPLYMNNVPAGEYCITVTDTHGCSIQDCIIISSPEAITATVSTTAADCGTSTGSAELGVSGGTLPYSYAWSNGSITEDLVGVPAGSYSVNISDANGCEHTLQVQITGAPGVIAEALVSHNLCNSGTDGNIDLTILSGTGPFNIQWNNGSTDEDINALSAGTYEVNISDANGCTWNSIHTVSENTSMEVDVSTSLFSHGHNISVENAHDGSIQITPSGGTPPYAIEWSNGMSGANINGLGAGTYVVEVTDANGCSVLRTIELTEPQILEMPTGYSPNGDGQNDTFIIRGLEAFPENTFTVFNRWGNVVYDRLNYKNDWAGDNSIGEELPNGTYFVILTLNKGERTLQGYVDMRR